MESISLGNKKKKKEDGGYTLYGIQTDKGYIPFLFAKFALSNL